MSRTNIARRVFTKKAPYTFFTDQPNPSLSKAGISPPQAPKKMEPRKDAVILHPTPTTRPNFFTLLKLEEKRQFPYKSRDRFDYTDNFSAALALPCSNQRLATNQQLAFALAEKNIIEHANRRVDLFFYTLIAYYRSGLKPAIGRTEFQHGKGRTVRHGQIITEACHSSIFSSLLDSTIYQTNGARKSLICGTHLMESLNATMELPPCVNDLDDLIENTCRKKSINILRDVSQGIVKPVKGLNYFLKMMNKTLNNFKEIAEHEPTCLSRKSFLRQKPINPKLIDLVITGTLQTTFSQSTQSVSEDYLQLLLRIKPKETELCKKQADKEKLYLDKVLELQKEILSARNDMPQMSYK